ncbi:MAG: hypothetical protein LQ350_004721 [Teloschistes chrysophthalmus]|nr:MAG: hypothetical protein LQ350_004721 [Niorma chrysophthalma]
MPTLKQLTCNVEWSASGSNLPLQEYGTHYADGLVETYLAIPPVSTPFSIRLRSDGYIAPGVSMFVYIDGEYQCNRGRNNLQIPSGATKEHHTNVNFVVRQKEEAIPDGQFLGKQWMFSKPEHEPAPEGSGYTGTIEVVVLRCESLPRSKAPNPSASEPHPRTLGRPLQTSFGSFSTLRNQDNAIQNHGEDDLSDVGGLFDGATLLDEPYSHADFGGDGSWDEPDPPPHFKRDWHAHRQAQQNNDRLRGRPSGDVSIQSVPSSIPSSSVSPTIVINVNQPGAGVPAQQPQNSSGGRAVNDDSWQTWMHNDAPQPNRLHSSSHSSNQRGLNGGNQFGADVPANQSGNGFGDRTTNDDGWQTWMHAEPPQQDRQHSQSHNQNHRGTNGQRGGGSSADNGWNYSSHEKGGNQNQGMSSGWDEDNHNQQAQNNNDQDGSWYKNDYNGGGQSTGWNHNNEHKDDQHGKDSNGGKDDYGKNNWHNDSNNNNGNTGNGGWDTYQSAKSHHGNGSNNDDQNGGGWDTNHNDQGNNNGWDTGNNNGQSNNSWNDTADENKNQDSGDTWGNANTGGQDARPSGEQTWNTGGNDHTGWGHGGEATNSPPAVGEGQDHWGSRSHHTSSKKANSVRSNVSKPISIRSAVQNPAVLASHQAASSGFKKPYYLVTDAVGNPMLPNVNPAPVAVAPPPPPPVAPTQNSYFQGGKPTVYYHKIASPKYMDTHEKPYAVFVFRYRTKTALEQILNITISDSDEMQKAELANLSKEELIKKVLASKSKLGSGVSVHSVPRSIKEPASNWNGNGNGYGNAGSGFGAALHDKLGAAAAQQNNSVSSISSISNSDKNAQDTNKGNASGWPASENGGGGHVAAWLSKTPAGGSVSGHKPWGGNGNGSNKGQSWNGGNNGGGSQKSGSWNNKNGGGHGSQSGGQNGAMTGANNGGEGPSAGW